MTTVDGLDNLDVLETSTTRSPVVTFSFPPVQHTLPDMDDNGELQVDNDIITELEAIIDQTNNPSLKSVTCKHCHSEYSPVDVDEHLSQCPQVPVTCPCGEEVTRNSLKDHQSVHGTCSLTLVICPVPSCMSQLPRGELPKHLQNDFVAHTLGLSAGYRQLENEVKALKSEMVALRSENMTLLVQIRSAALSRGIGNGDPKTNDLGLENSQSLWSNPISKPTPKPAEQPQTIQPQHNLSSANDYYIRPKPPADVINALNPQASHQDATYLQNGRGGARAPGGPLRIERPVANQPAPVARGRGNITNAAAAAITARMPIGPNQSHLEENNRFQSDVNTNQPFPFGRGGQVTNQAVTRPATAAATTNNSSAARANRLHYPPSSFLCPLWKSGQGNQCKCPMAHGYDQLKSPPDHVLLPQGHFLEVTDPIYGATNYPSQQVFTTKGSSLILSGQSPNGVHCFDYLKHGACELWKDCQGIHVWRPTEGS